MEETDTIILRFNYTEYREYFEVNKLIGKNKGESYTEKYSLSPFLTNDGQINNNNEGCKMGDFYNNIENYHLYLCLNAKVFYYF